MTLEVADGADETTEDESLVTAVFVAAVVVVAAVIEVTLSVAVVEAGTSVAVVGTGADVDGTVEPKVLERTTSHMCAAPGRTSPSYQVSNKPADIMKKIVQVNYRWQYPNHKLARLQQRQQCK